MSEEEIRQLFSGAPKAPIRPKAPVSPVVPRPTAPPTETFKKFAATHLLCPTCKKAMPVRERIMLFLPDGDLYEYKCGACGTAVGTRKAGRA